MEVTIIGTSNIRMLQNLVLTWVFLFVSVGVLFLSFFCLFVFAFAFCFGRVFSLWVFVWVFCFILKHHLKASPVSGGEFLGTQENLGEHHETSQASTGRVGMKCSAYKQNYSGNLRQNWTSMRQALDETQRLNYTCRLGTSLIMSNNWEKGGKKFLMSVAPVPPNNYASFVHCFIKAILK